MSGSKKHRHYSEKTASSQGSLIAKVPIVLLSMILSGLLLLLISAYFALKTDSPILLSSPLSLAALYLSALVGGVVCSLTLEKPQSYICSIVSSSFFVIITVTLKAFIPKSLSSPQTIVSIFLHALIVLVCVAGVYAAEKCKYGYNRRHRIRR